MLDPAPAFHIGLVQATDLLHDVAVSGCQLIDPAAIGIFLELEMVTGWRR